MNARAFCYRCHKAQRTCVCASVPRVANRTQVIVVQHPREQRHPIGSLRFARLGLERCRIAVADTCGPLGEGLVSNVDIPADAALLYPGEGARELAELPAHERPRTLVLLDGTWTTVRKLLDGDPRLRALPRVRVTPTIEQRYRIRREPRGECMSTLEAMIAALAILEKERGAEWESLLEAFDQMIDRQIEIAQGIGRPRHRRAKTKQQFRAVPSQLGVDAGPMVLVNVETTQSNRFGQAGTRARRELVRLSAIRIAAEEAPTHFDSLVRVEGGLPGDRQLTFMGVDVEALRCAPSPAEVTEAWRAFVKPHDRLAAWNQLALDLLPAQAAAEQFVLKGIFANLRRERAGDLEAACQRVGLSPRRAEKARGLRRLAAAHALYVWLCEQRETPPR